MHSFVKEVSPYIDRVYYSIVFKTFLISLHGTSLSLKPIPRDVHCVYFADFIYHTATPCKRYPIGALNSTPHPGKYLRLLAYPIPPTQSELSVHEKASDAPYLLSLHG